MLYIYCVLIFIWVHMADASKHQEPPRRADDAKRVEYLKSLNILDTPATPAFDSITREASDIMQTPIALILLVDTDRQWFKSKVGLLRDETPRSLAFCAHAIYPDNPGTFVVEDPLEDERFKYSNLVHNYPHSRFYAGAPLVSYSADGTAHNLGTLCIIDTQPRTIKEDQLTKLVDLSKKVMAEIERHQMQSEAA